MEDVVRVMVPSLHFPLPGASSAVLGGKLTWGTSQEGPAAPDFSPDPSESQRQPCWPRVRQRKGSRTLVATLGHTLPLELNCQQLQSKLPRGCSSGSFEI